MIEFDDDDGGGGGKSKTLRLIGGVSTSPMPLLRQ